MCVQWCPVETKLGVHGLFKYPSNKLDCATFTSIKRVQDHLVMRYSTGMKFRCPSCLVEIPSVKRILDFYYRLILSKVCYGCVIRTAMVKILIMIMIYVKKKKVFSLLLDLCDRSFMVWSHGVSPAEEDQSVTLLPWLPAKLASYQSVQIGHYCMGCETLQWPWMCDEFHRFFR